MRRPKLVLAGIVAALVLIPSTSAVAGGGGLKTANNVCYVKGVPLIVNTNIVDESVTYVTRDGVVKALTSTREVGLAQLQPLPKCDP